MAVWAGNSVPVLLVTYARCISGDDATLKERIEKALTWQPEPVNQTPAQPRGEEAAP